MRQELKKKYMRNFRGGSRSKMNATLVTTVILLLILSGLNIFPMLTIGDSSSTNMPNYSTRHVTCYDPYDSNPGYYRYPNKMALGVNYYGREWDSHDNQWEYIFRVCGMWAKHPLSWTQLNSMEIATRESGDIYSAVTYSATRNLSETDNNLDDSYISLIKGLVAITIHALHVNPAYGLSLTAAEVIAGLRKSPDKTAKKWFCIPNPYRGITDDAEGIITYRVWAKPGTTWSVKFNLKLKAEDEYTHNKAEYYLDAMSDMIVYKETAPPAPKSLELIEPTETNPKIFGLHDDPKIATISYKVIDNNGNNIHGLTGSEFYSVEINNKPAEILTIVEQSDSYKMTINPPAQTQDGSYGICLEYSGFSDQEPNAALYMAPGADIAVCLDLSGSMEWYGRPFNGPIKTRLTSDWRLVASANIYSYIKKFDVSLETDSTDDEQYMKIVSPSGKIYGYGYTSYGAIDYMHNTYIKYVGAEYIGIFESGSVEEGLWKVYAKGVSNRECNITFSRGPSKIDESKEAAKYLMSTLSDNDKLSVVSFSTYASVDEQLIQLNYNSRSRLATTIDSLIVYGGTALGDGIETAIGELDSSRHRDKVPKIMIVFTDGIYNLGSNPIDQAYDAAAHGIKIYTVGYGNVDKRLLSKIAQITEGEFLLVPSMEKLKQLYNRMTADIEGSSRIISCGGTICNEQPYVSLGIDIDSLSDADFSLTWGGSELDMTLVDPNGNTINSTVANNDPDIELFSGNTYEIYKINSPVIGKWKLNIYAVDIPDEGEKYTATVCGRSNITLDLYSYKDTYYETEPIKIMAAFSDGTNPIIDANISVNVSHLGRDIAQFYLFDDGTHNDDKPSDGVYTNIYHSRISGESTFTANAVKFTDERKLFVGQKLLMRQSQKTLYLLSNEMPSSWLSVTHSYDDYITRESMFTISADDDMGTSQIHYIIDGGNERIGKWNEGVSFQINPTHGYMSGGHVLEYWAVDSIGCEEKPHHVENYILDTSGPIVNMSFDGISEVTPTQKWQINNQTLIILDAVDTGCGVASIHYRIDDGNWNEYNEPFTITEEGIHTLYYYAMDKLSNFGTMTGKTIQVGGGKPTTTGHITPEQPTGNNGWYVSNVTVTLTASDEASGVNYTMCRIDDGEWQTYIRPFIVDGDGIHTIQYYSVDKVGNIEDTKESRVKMDLYDPDISVNKPLGYLYILDRKIIPLPGDGSVIIGQITIEASLSDTASGAESAKLYVDNELKGTFGSDIKYTLDEMKIGACKIKIIAYDNAGNTATDEQKVWIFNL